MALIAELKQASPSAGVIRKENDIPGRIKAYTLGGAAALSILTEEDYFHGSPQLLEEARRQTHCHYCARISSLTLTNFWNPETWARTRFF